MKVSKKILLQFVKNDICEIPILYHCVNIAFSVAEDFKNRICVPCWYDCREIFHGDYPKANHIFVNHKKQKYVKLKSFMESLEEILKIKNKSIIIKTGRKTASLIILSSFWKTEVNFSLLTLLLRVALYKNFDSYSNKVFSYCKYLNDTKNAVNLFMSGHTTYLGNQKSWYGQFKYLTKVECKKLLQV